MCELVMRSERGQGRLAVVMVQGERETGKCALAALDQTCIYSTRNLIMYNALTQAGRIQIAPCTFQGSFASYHLLDLRATSRSASSSVITVTSLARSPHIGL